MIDELVFQGYEINFTRHIEYVESADRTCEFVLITMTDSARGNTTSQKIWEGAFNNKADSIEDGLARCKEELRSMETYP